MGNEISKWNGVERNWEIAKNSGGISREKADKIIEAARGLGGVSFKEMHEADLISLETEKNFIRIDRESREYRPATYDLHKPDPIYTHYLKAAEDARIERDLAYSIRATLNPFKTEADTQGVRYFFRFLYHSFICW